MNTDIFAPHCGAHEHVVFFAKIKATEDTICICLEPGLQYGFRLGAAGKPPKVSFSVDGMLVRGEFDWIRIDGSDWTYLSMSHEGATYSVWVSRPETEGDLPVGRLEIKGRDDRVFELDPASILHDLPFK